MKKNERIVLYFSFHFTEECCHFKLKFILNQLTKTESYPNNFLYQYGHSLHRVLAFLSQGGHNKGNHPPDTCRNVLILQIH